MAKPTPGLAIMLYSENTHPDALRRLIFRELFIRCRCLHLPGPLSHKTLSAKQARHDAQKTKAATNSEYSD
jgi:hypothetical protein